MAEEELLTEVILTVFRLNGTLLKWGDELTSSFNLTSARWQVMGALREKPATVSDISRSMGLTRQSVQRIVDLLVDSGYLHLIDNPAHIRAKLVNLTKEGKLKYTNIMDLYEQQLKIIFQKMDTKSETLSKTIITLNNLEKSLNIH